MGGPSFDHASFISWIHILKYIFLKFLPDESDTSPKMSITQKLWGVLILIQICHIHNILILILHRIQNNTSIKLIWGFGNKICSYHSYLIYRSKVKGLLTTCYTIFAPILVVTWYYHWHTLWGKLERSYFAFIPIIAPCSPEYEIVNRDTFRQ